MIKEINICIPYYNSYCYKYVLEKTRNCLKNKSNILDYKMERLNNIQGTPTLLSGGNKFFYSYLCLVKSNFSITFIYTRFGTDDTVCNSPSESAFLLIVINFQCSSGFE